MRRLYFNSSGVDGGEVATAAPLSFCEDVADFDSPMGVPSTHDGGSCTLYRSL